MSQLQLTAHWLSTTVDSVSDLKELTDAATANDPRAGLRAVRALGRLLEHLERTQVDRARAAGWSWQEIGDVLGVSRQAVHKKHARR
jgi:DNA-directed RNA polymerase specialized sigma24 family protein